MASNLTANNLVTAYGYDCVQYERLVFRKIDAFLDRRGAEKNRDGFGLLELEPMFSEMEGWAFPKEAPQEEGLRAYLSGQEFFLFLRGYLVSREGASEISKDPSSREGALYSDAARFNIADSEFVRLGIGKKSGEAEEAMKRARDSLRYPPIGKGQKEKFGKSLSELAVLAGGAGFDLGQYDCGPERADNLFDGLEHYNRRFSEFSQEELKKAYLEIAGRYVKESRTPLIVPPERGLPC